MLPTPAVTADSRRSITLSECHQTGAHSARVLAAKLAEIGKGRLHNLYRDSQQASPKL